MFPAATQRFAVVLHDMSNQKRGPRKGLVFFHASLDRIHSRMRTGRLQEIEQDDLPAIVVSCERFAGPLSGWKIEPVGGGGAVGKGSAVPSLHVGEKGAHCPSCSCTLQFLRFGY